MPINIIDFNGPDGQADNMGGLTQRLFYARKADFLTIQTPVTTPATFDAVVDIVTAHIFKTGKCFKKMYITEDKGKLKADTQGDMDGHSFKQEVESFLPGSDSLAHGFAAKAKNDQWIVLAEQPDGKLLQVGTEMFPARCIPSFNTGSNASGTRGYDFKWGSSSPINYVYAAAVPLIPAT